MAALKEAESLPGYDEAMANSKKRTRSDTVDSLEEGELAGKDVTRPQRKRKNTEDATDNHARRDITGLKPAAKGSGPSRKAKPSRRPAARYDSTKVRQLQARENAKQVFDREDPPVCVKSSPPGLPAPDPRDRPSADLSEFVVRRPIALTKTRPGPSPTAPSLSSEGLTLPKIDFSKLGSAQVTTAGRSSAPAHDNAVSRAGSGANDEVHRLQAAGHEPKSKQLKEEAYELINKAALLLSKAAAKEKKEKEHEVQVLL